MKKLSTLLIVICGLSIGACSHPENETANQQPTPDPRVQADSERLQKATAKMAESRRDQTSPAATPSATGTPQ